MDRLPRKEKGIRISTKAVNVFVFILSFFLITFIMLQSDLSIILNNKSSVNSLSKLLHEEKQYFNLVSIDGYFLGRGFIDGESVYIFQTEDNNVLSNLYILPVSNTTVITNSDSNRLLVSQKTYMENRFNPETRKFEPKENIRTDYTIYLINSNIKDYGVIQQKTNNTITFVPFFFY